MAGPTLMWFRRDLRLDDNPAWAAAASGEPVIALYVLDPALLEPAGPYRRRQLLANLAGLDAALAELGGRLHVRRGDPTHVVPAVAAEVEAASVCWNADVTPYAQARDRAVEAALTAAVTTFFGGLVHPPGSVLTQKGTLSRVFTPFYRRWSATALDAWPDPPDDVTVADDPGDELPAPDDVPPLPGGSAAAHERLAAWLEKVDDYPDTHDRPDLDGTSQLSSDLRFGTLGPRELLHAVGTASPGREAFVRQLAWRDWYAHLLHGQPGVVDRAVRAEYDRIQWRDDDAGFAAWREGRTGYPIVDAGMRQLAETGWMHNRVRMIVASFLVKDLLVDWRRGERWFRHLLVDGDVPQNVGNWQWVAGTGPDAAPYFRVFNPVGQAEKFDPRGEYIRRFVPELAELSPPALFAPWEAGPIELEAAGVVLGTTYPEPIVDHKQARERTIAAYKLALAT